MQSVLLVRLLGPLSQSLFVFWLRIALVDKYVVEHFLTEEHLMDHLRFVRDVFCHEQRDISQPILDAIFTAVRVLFPALSCALKTNQEARVLPPVVFATRPRESGL